MSKSKEKKIAQIKNRKIWPFVVAILVIILVFTVMSVALLGTGFTNLVLTKAQTLYQTVRAVEDRYVECQRSGEDFSAVSETIYKYMPDVQGICIVDENNQLLQQYGDSKPDFYRMRVAGGETDSSKSDTLWTDMKVEDDMESALANREFKVYLQPKYSTKEEKLSGAEALVRWIHPTEGFIAPNQFIPIFERNGFILQLDDYMISECARMQAQWLHEGKKIVPISVNVSRAHFTKVNLAEHICQLVDQYNVPHNMIELELTESAFFDDKDILINTVKN